jgi:hypothetical protein
VNPYIGIQITNLQHIKLGIEEFTVPYADKIAFVLKSVDAKGNELYKIWISERNFQNMFRIQKKHEFSGEIEASERRNETTLPSVGNGGLEDD